jgi:hypothetical protein
VAGGVVAALAENVLLLRPRLDEEGLVRAIALLKTRDAVLDPLPRQYLIDAAGFHVTPRTETPSHLQRRLDRALRPHDGSAVSSSITEAP